MNKRRGDRILLNDPLPQTTPELKAEVLEWFYKVLPERLTKMSPDTPVLIIQSRVHEEDVPGLVFLDNSDHHYEFLTIPENIMTTCTDIAERREKCLAYIVKNYPQWPAKYTLSPGAASHHGYIWSKVTPDSPWALHGPGQGCDTITEADYIKEYEDTVKMSDLFDVSTAHLGLSWALLDPDALDDVKLSLTSAQHRALCVAISHYDGMKAKLNHARKSVRRLTNELRE